VEYRPEYYAVLEAIAKGIDSVGKISERLGMGRGNIERMLQHLEISGLVSRARKGLVFKRDSYILTPAGWRKLDEWRDRAKADLEKAATLIKRGAEGEDNAMEILAPYIALLPFLLTLDHIAALGFYNALKPYVETTAEEVGEAAVEEGWGGLEGFEGGFGDAE